MTWHWVNDLLPYTQQFMNLVFINRALSFNKNPKELFNEKEKERKKIYQKRELRGGKIKVRTQGYIVAWYANADYRKKRSRFQFN